MATQIDFFSVDGAVNNPHTSAKQFADPNLIVEVVSFPIVPYRFRAGFVTPILNVPDIGRVRGQRLRLNYGKEQYIWTGIQGYEYSLEIYSFYRNDTLQITVWRT